MERIFRYFDFRKLIDVNYLKQAPSATFKFVWPILIVCGVSFLTGVLLRIIFRSPQPKYRVDYAHFISLWLIYPAIFGALLVFFRLEEIPTLGNRIFLLLLFLVWIYGIFWILVYGLTHFKKQAWEYKISQAKAKYLPKPKNRV